MKMNNVMNKSIFKNGYLFLFVTSIIWSHTLPTFDIGPISIFPLRLLIILSILLFIINSIKKEKIFFNRIERYTLGFFIFVLIKALIGLMWSQNILRTLAMTLYYFESFIIVIICGILINNKQSMQTVVYSVMLNVFIISMVGFHESITGNYVFLNTTYDYIFTYKNEFGFNLPLAQFFNTNDLATFLTLLVPLILMVDDVNIFMFKILKFATVFLVVFNVIMAESRGDLLGLIIMLVSYVLIKIHFNKDFLEYSKQIMNRLAIILLTTLPFLFYYVINYPFDERILIWKNTLNTFVRTLFIGVGVGNTAVVNSKMGYINTNIFDPHNYFLEFLSDFGLLSFLLFVFWIYLMFVNLNNSRFMHQAKLYIILFIIVSIVPSSMMDMYYIWLGFGIIYALTLKSINVTHKYEEKIRLQLY